METKSNCFNETKQKFAEYLLSLGYSKTTVESYLRTLSRLEECMSAHGETTYSGGIGAVFIKEECKEGQSDSALKENRRVIRRLDDFVKGGYSLRTSTDYSVPDCFSKDFNGYMEYLRSAGKRESTIKKMHYQCWFFLKDMHGACKNSLSEIEPQDIYRIFSKKVRDKINYCVTIRSFLRYLFKSGILMNDLSVFVPSVRRREPVPSVYTKAETGQLLSVIDTEKDSGKRDYAIILLALRLGIRSGDIVNLKVSDIDFHSDVIEFTQSKTGVPQRLAFLPELKDAIRTYLSAGRPDTHHPNLFISALAPLRPLTALAVSNLVTRHMKKAGIVKAGRKCGGHALRMTLASELVSEKVPYNVVRKILGHENTASMKHYVAFDMETLRSCVLEVPPFSGLYAAYISKRKGGK